MAKLTSKARSKLPSSTFAGPGRSYPIPDKAHAIAAKRLAPRGVAAGHISKAQESKIDARADKVLGKSRKK
jgi:hypothetical protein